MPRPLHVSITGSRDLWQAVRVILLAVATTAFALASSALHAQQAPVHLNPVIAKLAEGKTVFGLQTADLSLVNARELARAPPFTGV